MTQPGTQADLRKVVAWMGVALLSLSAIAVSVREIARTLSIFEVLSIRSAFGLAILVGLALARPALRAELGVAHIRLHAARNVVQFGGQYAWALAITLMPMAKVFALEFATPLLTAILAIVFLRERPRLTRLIAIGVGAVGIGLVQAPGTGGFDWLSLLPLSAALAFAVSGIVTKTLTRTQSGFAILFWMNAIQLPLNLVGVEWGFWTRIGSEALPAIAALCIAGTLGQYALAQALRHGDATLVVPLDFLRIPLIAVIGATFYAEPLDSTIFLGAGLLVAAILVNLRFEMRARPTGCAVKPAATDPATTDRSS